jgi:hypothetical protein
MKQIALIIAAALTAVLLTAPTALIAQSYSSSAPLVAMEGSPNGGGGHTASNTEGSNVSNGPLSHLAFGGGISPLGIQLQATTNLASHLNLRASGNFFNYSTNFTSNGINATAKLNLASAGASVDAYPFRWGFRISPGVLFYNQNQLTAATNVPAGTSFTLNDTTYYSANTNSATGATPIVGNGALGLNATKPAFTATVGFGNTARGNRHWSFPVDLGVAFIGAPTVKVSLSGWACADQAQTECSNLADPTNPISVAVQSNLTAQVAKWTSDLNPLKTYPILSAGVAYSFRIRK